MWETIFQVVSFIGLLLDFIGVLGLFFTLTKGLKPINIQLLTIDNLKRTQYDSSPEILVREFGKKINVAIEQSNMANKKTHGSSKKWLYLIVFGFFLQIISSLSQLF